MEEKETELLKKEAERVITRLFKSHLFSIEDLKYQHLIALKRLQDELSPEQIEILNYLDTHRYTMIRKRILDNGNETIRDLHNLLENFDVKLKDNILTNKQEKGK
jgi:hypothetical protein